MPCRSARSSASHLRVPGHACGHFRAHARQPGAQEQKGAKLRVGRTQHLAREVLEQDFHGARRLECANRISQQQHEPRRPAVAVLQKRLHGLLAEALVGIAQSRHPEALGGGQSQIFGAHERHQIIGLCPGERGGRRLATEDDQARVARQGADGGGNDGVQGCLGPDLLAIVEHQ